MAFSRHRGLPLTAAGAAALLASCGPSDETAFTLYRNSVTDPDMRLQIATFDAKEAASYNRENCEIAQGLFEGQSGVTVRYWCEKGRTRP